jgi:hypothetical protein
VRNLLDGRSTCLCFDDYTSEPIQIDNGIGQGDPLSMITFLFYNADLLDIAELQNESALAFIDDSLVAMEDDDFEDTISGIQHIMNCEVGVFEWSKEHNSSFEIDKLAVMHCTNKCL